LTVADVEMRRWVVVVVEGNDDAKESADSRHSY